eukprot:c27635_g1_i1 orf=66-269(-)
MYYAIVCRKIAAGVQTKNSEISVAESQLASQSSAINVDIPCSMQELAYIVMAWGAPLKPTHRALTTS